MKCGDSDTHPVYSCGARRFCSQLLTIQTAATGVVRRTSELAQAAILSSANLLRITRLEPFRLDELLLLEVGDSASANTSMMRNPSLQGLVILVAGGIENVTIVSAVSAPTC
jgi:hypothetical protein